MNIINQENLIDYLSIKRKKNEIVRLFCDIESFTYNKKAGNVKPKLYKSDEYSLAVSYFLLDEDFPRVTIFNTFRDFLYFMTENAYKKYKYTLVFHNGNKYDNHFFRNAILKTFPDTEIENMYLRNAVTNSNTVKLSKLDYKKNTILEKRVKSSTIIDFQAVVKGIRFTIEDTYIKTNSSIRVLGKKLLSNGFLTEDYLKTDFNYLKYDTDDDINQDNLLKYQREIFSKLTDEELTYIKNDVIILAKVWLHFSKILFGFDYNAMTYTQNIKESYLINHMTEFQLLNNYNEKGKVNYTDYHFSNLNLYTYIKRFYKGGLNFYNDRYVGKIIRDKMFSMDINSSYPYAMYSKKCPTFISKYEESKKDDIIYQLDFENDNLFTIFEVHPNFLQNILNSIKSRVVRQIIVKYYSIKKGKCYVPSTLFKIIQNLTGLNITEIECFSYIEWFCIPFQAKSKISDYYYIKTQGKQKYKLNYHSPLNIEATNEPNTKTFNEEEIAGSKVHLNGIYGIPALRSHFNLFRFNDEKELVNIENGFKNNERNLIFSVAVTAFSLENLLYPLGYLSQEEIDRYFIYCDTDSLYLKKEAFYKIDPCIYHKLNLGKWDIENEEIDKFYVLNHKKYIYEVNSKIKIRCGGIVLSNFDTNMTFEKFIDTQFSHNVTIKNNHSILNNYGTITIYENDTVLQLGSEYYDYYSFENEKKFEIVKDLVKEELNKVENTESSELLYAETIYGSISKSDYLPEMVLGEFSLNDLKEIHKGIYLTNNILTD